MGLLAAVEDRHEPCSADGCEGTWAYTARAQLENLGRNAPAGLCSRHLAESLGLGTRDEPCRNDGCSRTWSWTAERQVEAAFPEGYTPGAKPRATRAPSRMCDVCFARSKTLEPRVVPCKVHGCTRDVEVGREVLLRAWVSAGSNDPEVAPPTPKVMCQVCREFCRRHPDREVVCARSSCTRTWTFKTGAQLQAFLAGQLQDPVRPCSGCEAEEAASTRVALEGVETMPCVVPGCGGVWTFRPGTQLGAASEGALPPDRMCQDHRDASGAVGG